MKLPNRMPEKWGLGVRAEHCGVSRRKVLGMLSAVSARMAASQRSFAQNIGNTPRIVPNGFEHELQKL
jgi:hypothetical protein